MRLSKRFILCLIALLAVGLLLAGSSALAAPNPVTNLRITALGRDSVTVAWGAPSGGEAVASYSLQLDGGAPVTPSGLSHSFGSLTAGNHTIDAYAVNGNGSSAATSITFSAGPTAEPQITSVTPGNTTLTINYTAPTGTMTGSFVRYEVSINGSAWSSAGALLTYTFPGLTNGTSYNIDLRAVYDTYATPATRSTNNIPVGPPDAPTNLVIAPSNGTLDLTWQPPANDGGSPITGYVVYYGSPTPFVIIGNNPTAQLTGLTNGTTYNIQIVARNFHGDSPRLTGRGVPATVPDAPQNLRAVDRGDGELYVTWGAPTFNGGSSITDYEIYLDGAYHGNTGLGTRRFYSITGLTNTTSYVVEVLAVNGQGRGARAQTTGIPIGVPSAPLNLQGEALDGEVRLTWEAPANNGGSPITGYDVRVNGGSPTRLGTALTYLYRNLTNNQAYSFEVRARNAKGTGSWSAPASVTPIDIPVPPSVPRNLTADPGNGWVKLTWQEPANLGKAPVEYEFSRDGTLWIGIGTALEYTEYGLTNGQPYTFYVRARNVAGPGPQATIRATPSQYAGTPPAPRNLRVEVFEGNMAILRWDLPYSDIYPTHYEISIGGQVWEVVPFMTPIYYLYGLDNNLLYTFYVRGVNERGTGVASKITFYGSDIPAQNNQDLVEAHTTPRQPALVVYDTAVLSQPGDGAHVGNIHAGETVGIIGSNAAGSWLRIVFDDDGKAGWVPAGAVAAQ